MRAVRFAIALCATLVAVAPYASAEDAPPAPPPPPPPGAAAPAPTAGEVVRAAEAAPAQPVIVMTPAPAPAPIAYAPVAAPCAPACPAPCPCSLPRDACGWTLDSCGRRLGCFEVALQGTYSMIPDLEGPFGEDSFFPNQLRWDTLSPDAEFGGRGALRWHVSPSDWIELRGGYLGSFDDSARQTGVFGFSPATPAPPIVPGLIPGVSAVNTATFSVESEIWTAELNWWAEHLCEGQFRLDSVVGARVASFEETATVDNFATAFNPGFPGGPFVRSESTNLFIGLQAGGAVHWDLTPCFELNLSAKGMLGNLNRQSDVSDRSIFSGGSHAASLEEDVIVFGFEIETGLRWRVLPWLSVEAGYSLFFLDGVQRANEAQYFGASLSGAVQAQSDPDQLLTHTIFAGLTFQF